MHTDHDGDASRIWAVHRGDAPVVATAIHDGHATRPEVSRCMALEAQDRLREEDPFTGAWTEIAPNRVVALRSRFEVDLNRPRERAVYRSPDDAWGLEVWTRPPDEALVRRSLAGYDAFYAAIGALLGDLVEQHGKVLVLDLHSYNHRRGGPDAPAADAEANPQINVGTGTMADRGVWAGVIERFMADLRGAPFPGGPLDVRENVRFRGGHLAAWIHARHPDQVCVLSVEVKKFFMDEWSGTLDPALHRAVGLALRAALPGAVAELAPS